MGQRLVSTVKCYFEKCDKKVMWHIFVDPGTFACDDHAPGDYSHPYPFTDNSQEIVIQSLS